MQLRGAISTQKRLRGETDCNNTLSQRHVHWRQSDTGMDLEEEGLDCLEDSLIGNDVVLAECKRHSQNLHAALQPVMFKDRCDSSLELLNCYLPGVGSMSHRVWLSTRFLYRGFLCSLIFH